MRGKNKIKDSQTYAFEPKTTTIYAERHVTLVVKNLNHSELKAQNSSKSVANNDFNPQKRFFCHLLHSFAIL